MIPPEASALLESGRVATLGTIGDDGGPHLVPIVFALDEGDLVTAVDAKPKTTTRLARLDNIHRDPRVSILVHHYSENWAELWWLRADGIAHIEREGPAFDRALESLSRRYPQYEEMQIEGPVIRVSVKRVRIWRASPTRSNRLANQEGNPTTH